MGDNQAVRRAFDNAAQAYYDVAARCDQPGASTEDRNQLEALEEALKALGVVCQMTGGLSARDAFNVYGLELPTPNQWRMDRLG